jgi:hypothetical protein
VNYLGRKIRILYFVGYLEHVGHNPRLRNMYLTYTKQQRNNGNKTERFRAARPAARSSDLVLVRAGPPELVRMLLFDILAFARSSTYYARSSTLRFSRQNVSGNCFASCSFEHLLCSNEHFETVAYFTKLSYASWRIVLLWTDVLYH